MGDRHSLHLLQVVGHDRVALRCCRRPGADHLCHHQVQHQRRSLHHPLCPGCCRVCSHRPGCHGGLQKDRGHPQGAPDALVPAVNAIPGWSCHLPPSTFYLFIDVTDAMAAMGLALTDLETFRQTLLRDTGVSFCTRAHFGRITPGEDKAYVRFAYSGIEADTAVEACSVLKQYFENLPSTSS